MYWRLTETRSTENYYRISVLFFRRNPECCPYGHSLTRGMPQKISWLPCMLVPERQVTCFRLARLGDGFCLIGCWFA
jgi:hypothetical protein